MWKIIATFFSLLGRHLSFPQFILKRTAFAILSGIGSNFMILALVEGLVCEKSMAAMGTAISAPSNSGIATFAGTSMMLSPCIVSRHSSKVLHVVIALIMDTPSFRRATGASEPDKAVAKENERVFITTSTIGAPSFIK